MTPYPPLRTVLLLAAAFCLAGCCAPAWAQETLSPETAARDLAAEVLHRAGDGDLGAWTRSILDRALERAGEAARQTVPGSPAPLPAERHAAGIAAGAAGRAGTAEILIFTSLSVPAASWRQWAREAARAGAPLVLRGVAEDGLRATVERIGARLGDAKAGPGSGSPGSSPGQAGAGIAIDPRLFRLFGVERVPAVVVVPGGVPPCRSRGCAGDPAPPHDRIAGNIGLIAALQAIADEGAVGRDTARRQLERLRGEDRR